MSRIKYPPNLSCPSCKAEIKLDYEGRLDHRWRPFAATHDLLVMSIVVPYSRLSAQDANQDKQDIGIVNPRLLICQHCHAILGMYDKD